MYFSPKSENLYIIGNGFDLYLGLKTSYNDFFGTKLKNNKELIIKHYDILKPSLLAELYKISVMLEHK